MCTKCLAATPYGPRELVIARGDERSLAVAFASGAALGFALVGLVALARRRRAAPDARPPAVSERPPPWVTACEAVDRARVTLESEPVLALDALSIALRRYAAQRFGGSSHTRTTPELEASNPPFTLTTRWPVFLELLRDLDSRRFPASDDDCALRSATAALADRVAAFVEKTTPRDAS